jgi:hypothetical protein
MLSESSSLLLAFDGLENQIVTERFLKPVAFGVEREDDHYTNPSVRVKMYLENDS